MSIQAVTPILFFLVPVATIVLFLLAVARPTAHPLHIHVHILDRHKTRVVWVFPVIFSLALLSIAAGALLFVRQHSDAFSLALADEIVTAALYMELSFSCMHLLSVITTMAALRPVVFLLYCILLTTILISATLVSIVGSFKAMPLFLSPVLYLTLTILTLPVITFSLLSTIDRSEVSLAPEIIVASPSYPRSSMEKPGLFDDAFSAEDSSTFPPRSRSPPTTRNISVSVLCGQVSAIVHFGFSIAFLVLVPDQSSSLSTLSTEEAATGVWKEALAFQISRTAFLVIWIICTMAAFLQLYSKSANPHPLLRNSTLTSVSEATITAFTDMPPRSPQRPRIKFMAISRSSSFSSPRPRRHPLQPFPPPVPRRPSPIDDFGDLEDPFAFAPVLPYAGESVRNSRATASTAVDEPRPTRMSAWGTLTPPQPPPTALQGVRRPSLRALGLKRGVSASITTGDADAVTIGSKGSKSMKRRSMSIFTGYTSPSEYSQFGEGDSGFDMEEALLAQKLLQTLDAANNTSAGSAARRWRRS
ncbi:hypothetical protein C8F01DRAFT_226322 [Mycena amicta]|nr:hypothetical protein C8F01DRAFT_226322 [Mycena amicta]